MTFELKTHQDIEEFFKQVKSRYCNECHGWTYHKESYSGGDRVWKCLKCEEREG